MSVKICKDTYPVKSEFDIYFNEFTFPLSDFQKYSIEALVKGHDSLVCAPTGSGKSLPAEFAISFFTKKNLRVVYLSPIKALSNQKYHDFSKKFPNISIGLLTGDVKCNPDAQVLIMTTEIFRNELFRQKQFFKEDLSDLGSLVIDEVHYINDLSRGTVYEEILMAKLGPNTQLLMLSATLGNYEEFANWISVNRKKEIWISMMSERSVPLRHYSYMVFKNNMNDIDKNSKRLVEQYNKVPLLLKDENNSFNTENYNILKKLTGINKARDPVSKIYVMNSIVDHLYENDLLPAVFFSLSRKNVETFPFSIEKNLHKQNHDLSVIAHDARRIITTLPNYKEFINLPEYHGLIKLLEKGIAYHHAGMLSIFRELVELMFEKGHVKLLFASETISIGLNLPIKTTIFDNLYKFDGRSRRVLYSHEYTQSAGRAGRRGIDSVGYVFHLTNLCFLDYRDYKEILSGEPIRFKSQFILDYNLILHLLQSEKTIDEIILFIKNSNLQKDVNLYLKGLEQDLENVNNEISILKKSFVIDYDVLNRYSILKGSKINNKIRRDLEKIVSENPTIIKEYETFTKLADLEYSLKKIHQDLEYNLHYIDNNVKLIIKILSENLFISEKGSLTDKGLRACNIQEAHSLVLADILEDFNDFGVTEIIQILSIFNDSDRDSDRDRNHDSENVLIEKIITRMNYYSDISTKNNIIINYKCELSYSLWDLILEWSLAINEQECISVIQKLNSQEIYIGTFVKTILKINNLVSEMRSCKDISIELDHKLSQISGMTLKFMITNQSLYL
jgi:superfamily II RNA helicase